MNGFFVHIGQFFKVVVAFGLEGFPVFNSLFVGVGGLGIHFIQTGPIHIARVSSHSDKHIIRGQFFVLGVFDGRKHIGNAADTQQIQLAYQILRNAFFLQQGLSVFFVEQLEQPQGHIVVYCRQVVSVFAVMNPGNMFVADSLYSVTSEAVVHQSGTLESLGNHQFGTGKKLSSGSIPHPGFHRNRRRI